MAETPWLLGIYLLSPERPFLAVPDIPGCQVSMAIKRKGKSVHDLPFHYTRGKPEMLFERPGEMGCMFIA